MIAILVGSVGYEKADSAPVLGTIVPGSAAEDAGLQPGDRVLRFAGDTPQTWDDVVRSVRANADKQVPVEIQRASDGSEPVAFVVQVTPHNDGKGMGVLGVQQGTVKVRTGFFEGFAFAVKETWRRTVDQVRLIAGLNHARTNDATLGLPGMVRVMLASSAASSSS